MESIDEIPKYVRYDFFMALFGTLLIYLLCTNEILYKNSVLLILFSIIGVSTLLYGILEMKGNYERDKKISVLQYKKKYNQLKTRA